LHSSKPFINLSAQRKLVGSIDNQEKPENKLVENEKK
jgi:hypothetical protein